MSLENTLYWDISIVLIRSFIFLSGMIPFAGGSYLTYTLMDNSVIITATPLGNHLTPVYMFVSGCLAAAVAKVTHVYLTTEKINFLLI